MTKNITLTCDQDQNAYWDPDGEPFICLHALKEFGIDEPTITLQFSDTIPPDGTEHCKIHSSPTFKSPFWGVVYQREGRSHDRLTYPAFEVFLRKHFSPDYDVYITLVSAD